MQPHFRLAKILGQPTAPFREGHVLAMVESILDEEKIPHFRDPAQNIVVGVKSKAEYLKLIKTKSTEPVRIFIAHTDHPGFHGSEWLTADRLAFKWHGGSPTAHLEGGKVWLADSEGFVGEGRVEKAVMLGSGRAIDSGVIHVKDLRRQTKATDLFGGFGFRDTHWREGDLLYSKAADDLIGVYAILETAIALKKSKKKAPFNGLLTRAEEVGFIGTIAHLELGWWKNAKRKLLAVSLETSRTMPGADIGKGPVVRLGDRKSIFDSGATQVFSDLAARVLAGKHQRRLMDGGTCEGTAATAYGIPTIAISVPLGNYHNQSFEGGPDAAPSNGPAPEFVSISDIEGMCALTRAVMEPKLAWDKPFFASVAAFKKSLKTYAKLLRSGP
jgi:putative aminopeptidase FrvX